MRPTRWTRQRRVTHYGKGGYHFSRYGVGYTHPVTGNGWYRDWRNLLRLRRSGAQATTDQVRRAKQPPNEYGEWTRGNTGQVGRVVTRWVPSMLIPSEWMPVVDWEPHPHPLAAGWVDADEPYPQAPREAQVPRDGQQFGLGRARLEPMIVRHCRNCDAPFNALAVNRDKTSKWHSLCTSCLQDEL